MMKVKNDWRRRLAFSPPHNFTWRADPPKGVFVGENAVYRRGDRYYIRSINGTDVNLDKVGAFFAGYQAPEDHKPPRKRVLSRPVQGKWGTNVKEQCAAANLSPQTYYNRRRSGMPHELALHATSQEVFRWKAANKDNERAQDDNINQEWRDAAVWMTRMGLDRYLPPLSRSTFTTLYQKGLSAKQAILHHNDRRDRRTRGKVQGQIMVGAKQLRAAMPEVQKRLMVGPTDEGVILAAKLLSALNLMLSCETRDQTNTEVVYGNLVLAVMASAKGAGDE